MTQQLLTTEQMISILQQQALKICQLSVEVSDRQLAHTFVYQMGHTNTIDAHVLPADTTYAKGSPQLRVATLEIRFCFHQTSSEEECRKEFQLQVRKGQQYIAYLELILSKGEPVTTASIQGAA